MGRNKSHKKDLRAEKAKVKLKQTKTKFLPKGLNITDPKFKIQPIILLDQLKVKDDTILSRRKLNIPDLLSRIKHYNENVRHDACEELAEMVGVHSGDIINHHLSQIILNVSFLMQDRSRKVRKSAVKVVNTILRICPKEQVKPFFNYFSTNIRCAMTNIDKHIQEDSLLFLDCFLLNNCGIISEISEKLLPDFFSLISKLRSDSKLERTLTVNLGRKMTNVSWRIKVLSRLHAVLESIINIRVTEVNGQKKSSYQITACSDSSNTFSLYKRSFNKSLDDSILTNVISDGKIANEPDVLSRYVITLVPILYETWLEVVPEKKIGKAFNEYTILNEDASSVLSCIVNTLYLLWKYVTNVKHEALNIDNVFLSNEGKKFLNHLITNFPYIQSDNRNMQNYGGHNLKVLEINPDPKCVKENILIWHLYFVLNVNYSHNNLKVEMGAITSYITKCLESKNYLNQNNVQYLTDFLKICLLETPQSWKRSGVDLKAILESAITLYYFTNLGEKHKLEVFNILSRIMEDPYLRRCLQYNAWLSSLPNLLCEPKISDVFVDALLKFSRKNVEVFNMALQEKLANILENLDKLEIERIDSNNAFRKYDDKKNIINILFFIPVVTKKSFKIIREYAENHPKYYDHILSMLHLRLDLKGKESFHDELPKG